MKVKTILVIEDNKLNMKLVNGLIKIGKYRMLEAVDAESGIQLIREQRPDLVLMDIQLPGMDGLSATKVIKEDPDLKDIPIVALTSFAMQGDEEKALAAGCTGYITKPIDTRKFLETVSQYLKDDNL
jgi:CheY-like chemotaxis protein